MSVIVVDTNLSPFTFSGERKEIAPGVTVYSNIGTAAVDNPNFTGVFLLNYGAILNGGWGDGIVFGAATGTIFNEPGAFIAGDNGVTVHGNVSMINFGSITGMGEHQAGFRISDGSTATVLDNRGYIYGGEAGVRDYSDGGNTIINSGTIEGADFGINIHTFPGHVSFVVNSGLVRGGTFSVAINGVGGYGSVNLVNSGVLIGDIYLGVDIAEDANTIANSGTIKGLVLLSAGNDSFDGTGGTSGPIHGGDGDDRIIGGKGNDSILGDPGRTGCRVARAATTSSSIPPFASSTSTSTSTASRTSRFPLDTIDLKHSLFLGANAAGKLPASMFFVGAAAHDFH